MLFYSLLLWIKIQIRSTRCSCSLKSHVYRSLPCPLPPWHRCLFWPAGHIWGLDNNHFIYFMYLGHTWLLKKHFLWKLKYIQKCTEWHHKLHAPMIQFQQSFFLLIFANTFQSIWRPTYGVSRLLGILPDTTVPPPQLCSFCERKTLGATKDSLALGSEPTTDMWVQSGNTEASAGPGLG